MLGSRSVRLRWTLAGSERHYFSEGRASLWTKELLQRWASCVTCLRPPWEGRFTVAALAGPNIHTLTQSHVKVERRGCWPGGRK